ncbi:MAG TPA: hypothetical protein VEK74_13625 [Burkholderiaceae bacterium]|nr:hypothetical protein [Burkholderiaceae bacterium]
MLVDPFLVGVLLIVGFGGLGGSWLATRRVVRASHLPWVSAVLAVVGGLGFAALSLPFVNYADCLGTIWASNVGPAAVTLGAAGTVGAFIAVLLFVGCLAGSLIG